MDPSLQKMDAAQEHHSTLHELRSRCAIQSNLVLPAIFRTLHPLEFQRPTLQWAQPTSDSRDYLLGRAGEIIPTEEVTVKDGPRAEGPTLGRLCRIDHMTGTRRGDSAADSSTGKYLRPPKLFTDPWARSKGQTIGLTCQE